MVGRGRPVRPVPRAPGGAAADVLPWAHGRRGCGGPRRAARDGQVPDPLRPPGVAPGAAGERGDTVICPHRYDVAPYALGTLDAGEREDVADHIPGCQECQAVLESVAGLPGLLARVDPDDVAPARVVPDEAMFQRLLARSAEGRRMPRPAHLPAARPAHGPTARPEGHRRGPRRRLVLAAAAAAVLAAGGGWALREASPDDTPRVVTASSGPVHASVRVTPTPSGTTVRLELSGVQAEQRCSLIAVDRDGHRTVAATWEAGYTGTATFDGSVPVPADQHGVMRGETDTKTLVKIGRANVCTP